jgi:hypothetical protein
MAFILIEAGKILFRKKHFLGITIYFLGITQNP